MRTLHEANPPGVRRRATSVALWTLLFAGIGVSRAPAQEAVSGNGMTPGTARPVGAQGSTPGSTQPGTTPPGTIPQGRAAVPGKPDPLSTTLYGTAAPYLLRPGDSVVVSYRFTPEFDDTETIAPDGHLALKNIGQIQAAGASVLELQARVLDLSRAQLINPEVTVALREFDRPQIVVAGEVVYPGRMELRRPTTALQAILLAGGPKQDSAMGHVYVFRKVTSETAETHILNLRMLRTGDRAAHDLLLQPDDMVLVRHDALSTVERYMKLVNLGVYFNPLGNNGVF